MIAATLYATGMRLQEALGLRVADIDSESMRILVRNAKGGRERYVMLSPRLLDALREYYLEYRPRSIVFYGRSKGKALGPSAVQKALRRASAQAALRRRATPHVLRHSFATHLLGAGCERGSNPGASGSQEHQDDDGLRAGESSGSDTAFESLGAFASVFGRLDALWPLSKWPTSFEITARGIGASDRGDCRARTFRQCVRSNDAVRRCSAVTSTPADLVVHEVPLYNSCRNRHCPKCQSLDQERWLARQNEALLPVGYFHLVFTLPSELRALALRNPRILYRLLFRSASASLLELAADPKYLGARIGILALLHTWTQRLDFHPHLHCLVPAGGLDLWTGGWIASRKNFLVPVRALSRLFRGKLLAQLKCCYRAGRLSLGGTCRNLERPAAFQELLDQLYGKDWVVYCKAPFGNPGRALAYLARYTHRVAISNQRLCAYDGESRQLPATATEQPIVAVSFVFRLRSFCVVSCNTFSLAAL